MSSYGNKKGGHMFPYILVVICAPALAHAHTQHRAVVRERRVLPPAFHMICKLSEGRNRNVGSDGWAELQFLHDTCILHWNHLAALRPLHQRNSMDTRKGKSVHILYSQHFAVQVLQDKYTQNGEWKHTKLHTFSVLIAWFLPFLNYSLWLLIKSN